MQTCEINKQVEKARALSHAVARRFVYGESAKFVTFSPANGEGEAGDDARVVATLKHATIRRSKSVVGYNMQVTSETGMSARSIFDTYHALRRIEERFRVMKSELDARPTHLQRESAIAVHLLV